MATIAVELEKANDADLTLFLVEEPEAHLHPQLQAAVLSFLDEQAEKSRKPREGHLIGPAGEVQIIVATHSPNLSAWVESKKLIFFRSFLPNAGKPRRRCGGRGATASRRRPGRDNARDVMSPTTAKGILDFLTADGGAGDNEEVRKIYVGASRAQRLLTIALPRTQAPRLRELMAGMGGDVTLVAL
jgi:hypothetical protein